MSPRITLNSCGSSSRLNRRRSSPTRVTRGSSFSLNMRSRRPRARPGASRPRRSAPERIVRNFSIVNGRPRRPTRRCRYRIGPGESSLIATAIRSEQRRQHHQQAPRHEDVERELRDDLRAREPHRLQRQRGDARRAVAPTGGDASTSGRVAVIRTSTPCQPHGTARSASCPRCDGARGARRRIRRRRLADQVPKVSDRAEDRHAEARSRRRSPSTTMPIGRNPNDGLRHDRQQVARLVVRRRRSASRTASLPWARAARTASARGGGPSSANTRPRTQRSPDPCPGEVRLQPEGVEHDHADPDRDRRG